MADSSIVCWVCLRENYVLIIITNVFISCKYHSECTHARTHARTHAHTHTHRGNAHIGALYTVDKQFKEIMSKGLWQRKIAA